jgi:hypothetical protein
LINICCGNCAPLGGHTVTSKNSNRYMKALRMRIERRESLSIGVDEIDSRHKQLLS